MIDNIMFSPFIPDSRFLSLLVAASAKRGMLRMRADIGALLEGSSPLVSVHGLKGPPRPDVVVYSTNTGHQLLRWFEFYGAHYGVPVLGLNPPPALHELERIDLDAAVHQLLRL